MVKLHLLNIERYGYLYKNKGIEKNPYLKS